MIQALINSSVNDYLLGASILQQQKSKEFIAEVAEALFLAFQGGNKVLIAGNGGSLCDAMHFAEELTGFFRKKRKALPAIALSDPGHITCVGNDLGFDEIFSRSIEALGRPKDIFIGLTTSGNSKNLIKAFEAAKALDLTTVAFLGKGGGQLLGIADFELVVNGFTYSDRIQEVHMGAIHIIIEALEAFLENEPETSFLEIVEANGYQRS